MLSQPTRRTRLLSGSIVGLMLVMLIVPLVQAAPAATIIVDDFSANQGKLIATLGAPATSFLSGGGILGGERDLRTTVLTDLIGGGNATSEVINHSLSHSQDSGVTAQTLVQWDGADGTITLNPTGLGGVDLTQADTQNGLIIEVILNDLPIDLIFTVYSGAGNASQATITLPGGQPSGAGPKYYYLEYASFTPSAGSGANFQNVGAVEMLVNGYNDATDLTIHDVRTAAFDWGDLPDTSVGGSNYPTRFANNGPRHLIGNLALGTAIDSIEIDGVPSVPATGDDANNATNDEDGVRQTPGVLWQFGPTGGSVDVVVTGGAACLAGWIDWNGDGTLTGSGENIFNGQSLTAGSHTLTFSVPVNPGGGSYYARFRLFAPETGGGCLSNYTPTGRAINGEVEDYRWGFGPNAVSLSGFNATATGLPLAVGLVVPASLALVGVAYALRRRIA